MERICQKALSKRAAERYSTAKDLADDVRQFLTTHPAVQRSLGSTEPLEAASSSSASSTQGLTSTASAGAGSSDSQPIRIVPKGLRSFDEHDADFFLELLPGPRDRDGLPDSLRFWKTKIEETDSDKTFSVGLIYGPSGCGKSSLVKAGLLPRLADNIIPIYVEAAPDDTESRLLHGLRKRCSTSYADLSLKETLAGLRQGQSVPPHGKVLIVLDQFEQWLHAKREEEHTELVQALRQCDGGRVRCIVMVRDDFWMAATRFMRELEVRLVEAENSSAVDLFPLRHAEKVLAAFGQAFGVLPQTSGDVTDDHKAFLKQAVAGLGEEGKVVCVRLALFADMMKDRPWTPATLKEVGGAKGVGVNFLEATFSASTAPPEHRLHQKPARAVLKALLPESGTDIKGEMKSYGDLLEVSGCANRTKDFNDLIRILDSELRLITPTDPTGVEAEDSASQVEVGQKYYQLTHDYLVHSLREWLTRKKKETRRGRAELRLVERESLWNARPETRNLPAWWEYLSIRLLTTKKSWTEPQRRMMAKACRTHAARWGTALVALLIATGVVQRFASAQRHQQAEDLVQAVLSASTESLPVGMQNLELQRRHAILILRQRMEEASDPKVRARAALVLNQFMPVDERVIVHSIKAAQVGECRYFVDALRGSPSALELLRENADQARNLQEWEHLARLAIVALHLGDSQAAEELCGWMGPDPTRRTVFIDVFAGWHEDLATLRGQIGSSDYLEAASQSGWRSGLCLALGSVENVDQKTKDAWGPLLRNWYSNQPDALTHSAAEWVLKRWKLNLPPILPLRKPAEDFDWYLETTRLTMIRVRSGRFDRKDQFELSEKTQTVHVTQEYWLSACEITIGLFREFIDDDQYPGEGSDAWVGEHIFPEATREHPVQRVMWYDAVKFCNWLSWKQDLQQCYKVTALPAEENEVPEYDVELIEGANGFRLPTEAEWEYSCRAGTSTRFSCGDDPATLNRYAVFGTEQPAMVGSKMCNAWGFHDMHANVWEWCWDWWGDEYVEEGHVEDPLGPSTGSSRVSRSGGHANVAIYLVSGHRLGLDPSLMGTAVGFRVARSHEHD